MNARELRRMYELESTYWWFVGRRDVIRVWLEGLRPDLPPAPQILDVGCGTGGNAVLLQEFGRVTGSDVAPEALAFCRERGLENLVQCSGDGLTAPDEAYDLVTSFEVFEHVENDRLAAREAYRVLKPGGKLLVTVPAYAWLWSEHDVALGHRRRYARRELISLLEGAGFEIERLSHCVTLLLPTTVLFRILQKAARALRIGGGGEPQSGLVILPRPVSALFAWTLRVEAALLRHMNLPWGVTLIARATRKADAGRYARTERQTSSQRE